MKALMIAISLLAQLTNIVPRTAVITKTIQIPDTVVLDLRSDGLNLSGKVTTSLLTGQAVTSRWTVANTDDAFLMMNATTLRGAGFDVRRGGMALDGYVMCGDGLTIKGPDGVIRTITEGWQGLATFDRNGDGKLNSSDAAWSHFAGFTDTNADGAITAGELRSMTDRGVREIRLASQAAIRDAFGNTRKDGTFTRNDGTTATMSDVNFGGV